MRCALIKQLQHKGGNLDGEARALLIQLLTLANAREQHTLCWVVVSKSSGEGLLRDEYHLC